MNRLIPCVFLFLALLCISCQDTKEDLNNPTSEKDIYKAVGEEIPFETGMSWIEYYQKSSGQGRTDLLSSFEVSREQMNNVMGSTPNLVGIAFHHAIDESGEKHILVIPVDESLSLWASIEGRIFVDANTGEAISQATAAQWAQNFKDQNPDKIWFHFFGSNIFGQMFALPFFDTVEIQPAISILNLTPQLLLVVWNDGLIPFGRTKNPPGVVYDASNACPPCAVR